MIPAAAPALRFSKMHGAGNDFVVIDRRSHDVPLPRELVQRLCDRHRGVGCDQLLTIEPARTPGALLAYGIRNADGSDSGQCGNGARCILAWAQRDGLIGTGQSTLLDSPSGPVAATIDADGAICVSLQAPDFEPASIPFDAPPAERHRLDIDGRTIWFQALSMGNPHAVVQTDDVAAADLARIAAAIQSDPRFPESCNVGLAQPLDRARIRLRVAERGVGETLACGSGACAAVAALSRRGLLDARVAVELPGGTLDVTWPGGSAPVQLRGPTAFVFEGEWLA
ncbi:MAG: diaminopimelate epimerase [Lysobacteraceae bacterium]